MADLKALTGVNYQTAVLAGYWSNGDGGGGVFVWDGASTATDDGGTIIQPTGVAGAGRWKRLIFSSKYDVRFFGAKGDGATNDRPAIQNTINAASAKGGGEVFFAPTGKAYLITSGITVPAGVILTGIQCQSWPGPGETADPWTATGSWIKVGGGGSFVGVSLSGPGHASGIKGLNFMTDYGVTFNNWSGRANNDNYIIKVSVNNFSLEDLMIINAAKGINVEYTTGSGGGTYSYLRNIHLSCFSTGLRLNLVNDTLAIDNIHFRYFVFSGNPTTDANAANFLATTYVGMQIGYCDNPLVTRLNFFQCYCAIQLFNDTCLGYTHSLFNAKFDIVDINLCQYAIQAGAGVYATGTFSNVLCQGAETNFGLTVGAGADSTLFSLRSDSVEFQFSNLRCTTTGGALMEIGTATSTSATSVVIDNVKVNAFSNAGVPTAPVRSCFVTYGSARLRVGIYDLRAIAGQTFFSGTTDVKVVSVVTPTS